MFIIFIKKHVINHLYHLLESLIFIIYPKQIFKIFWTIRIFIYFLQIIPNKPIWTIIDFTIYKFTVFFNKIIYKYFIRSIAKCCQTFFNLSAVLINSVNILWSYFLLPKNIFPAKIWMSSPFLRKSEIFTLAVIGLLNLNIALKRKKLR